jgi:hypothetical protein
MKRIKISEHFYLDEYVDIKTYYRYKNNLNKLVYQITYLNEISESIREKINSPVIINNWWEQFILFNYDVKKTFNEVERRSDLYQWSGLRTKESPDYTKNSLHTTFNAIDMKFTIKWKDILYPYIRENWRELKIKAMEINKSWLHVDMRFIPYQKKLYEF